VEERLKQLLAEILPQMRTSPQQLAEATDLPRRHIADFMNGRRHPSDEGLGKIVQAITEHLPSEQPGSTGSLRRITKVAGARDVDLLLKP
jgi:hypothetical protein